MIILQFLAFLVSIPLTILLLIVFNCIAISWVCFLLIAFFVFFYAAMVGLIFYSTHALIWVFTILMVLYFIRLGYLYIRFRNKNYSSIKVNIKNKSGFRFNIAFIFPLTFLKILKLTPSILKKEFYRKTGVEICSFIDIILHASKETKIDISTEELDLYFEIK